VLGAELGRKKSFLFSAQLPLLLGLSCLLCIQDIFRKECLPFFPCAWSSILFSNIEYLALVLFPFCFFLTFYNLLWNFTYFFFAAFLWPGLSKEAIESDSVRSLLPSLKHLKNHHFCNRSSYKIPYNYCWKSRPYTQALLKPLFILIFT